MELSVVARKILELDELQLESLLRSLNEEYESAFEFLIEKVEDV